MIISRTVTRPGRIHRFAFIRASARWLIAHPDCTLRQQAQAVTAIRQDLGMEWTQMLLRLR